MHLHAKYQMNNYESQGVLYRVMEQWDGDTVTVCCQGSISVTFDNYYDKVRKQNINKNRLHTNYRSYECNALKNIKNQQNCNKNNRYSQNRFKQQSHSPRVDQNYIFRAKSPNLQNNCHKFAEIADQYSNSRLITSRSKSINRNQKINTSRTKKYSFNFPSRKKVIYQPQPTKTTNINTNKQNINNRHQKLYKNTQNIQQKPCLKATITKQIEQSIKNIKLPQHNFMNKGHYNHHQYKIANNKFQQIKGQILDEIVTNTDGKQGQIQIQLEEILSQLKQAADNIIAKHHNTRSRNKSPVSIKQYQSQKPTQHQSTIPVQQPKLRSIFSFNQNGKHNDQLVQSKKHQNYAKNKNIDEQSEQIIHLPQFKDDSKSISSIMSDGKNENSLQPLGQYVSNEAKKINNQDCIVNNTKYINIENQCNNQDYYGQKNKIDSIKQSKKYQIQEESVQSIKMPEIKPIQILNSGIYSQANKTINQSQISNSMSKPEMSLADVLGKIGINKSVQNSQKSIHMNYKIDNNQGSLLKSKSIQQSITQKQSFKQIPSLNTQNNASKNNNYEYENKNQYNTKPTESKYERVVVTPAPPINIQSMNKKISECDHNGLRFMRKQHVVKHFVDKNIIEKQSNSIEYSVFGHI